MLENLAERNFQKSLVIISLNQVEENFFGLRGDLSLPLGFKMAIYLSGVQKVENQYVTNICCFYTYRLAESP